MRAVARLLVVRSMFSRADALRNPHGFGAARPSRRSCTVRRPGCLSRPSAARRANASRRHRRTWRRRGSPCRASLCPPIASTPGRDGTSDLTLLARADERAAIACEAGRIRRAGGRVQPYLGVLFLVMNESPTHAERWNSVALLALRLRAIANRGVVKALVVVVFLAAAIGPAAQGAATDNPRTCPRPTARRSASPTGPKPGATSRSRSSLSTAIRAPTRTTSSS